MWSSLSSEEGIDKILQKSSSKDNLNSEVQINDVVVKNSSITRIEAKTINLCVESILALIKEE